MSQDTGPPPNRALTWGARSRDALASSLPLNWDCLRMLGERALSVSLIAASMGANRVGVARLLEALAATGYLDRVGTRSEEKNPSTLLMSIASVE